MKLQVGSFALRQLDCVAHVMLRCSVPKLSHRSDVGWIYPRKNATYRECDLRVWIIDPAFI